MQTARPLPNNTRNVGLEAIVFSNRLNLEIVKNGIDMLRKLSKLQDDFLSYARFNPEVDVLDDETLAFVASELGFAISGEFTYSALVAKGTDFSVGDLTTAFRSIELFGNVEHCRDIFTTFAQTESAWKHLGDHNGEITAKILPLLTAE